MKPIALTSKATKECDVSITMIYRANSPTNYARVSELEFHCIFCQFNLWWSFLYISNHATTCNKCTSMRGEGLSTKLKAQNQIPFKPSKTSPPLASIAKMGEKN
jgi:hypothetical protein